MSELGEFLERFYSPAPTFRTVRARILHTTMALPSGASKDCRSVIGRKKPGARPRDEREETHTLWAVPPDRVRLETQRIRLDQAENIIEMSNGEYAWQRFADGTVEREATPTSRADGKFSLPSEYQRHFDRGLLRDCFAALTLEANGACRVAGRECLCIRAVPIPGKQLWPHWLAWEADEYEFAADVGRIVLLSITGKVAGTTSEQHEVLDVAFDEELDESLFTCDVEPEEIVKPITPIVVHISLEAANSLAPFTVLRPTWLPENHRLQCNTMHSRVKSGSPDESVSLCYRGAASFERLWIEQRAERDVGTYEHLYWETKEVRGRRMEISDPSPEEGLRVVAFEQDGTYIEIITDMDLDTLLKVAVSFEPVDG